MGKERKPEFCMGAWEGRGVLLSRGEQWLCKLLPINHRFFTVTIIISIWLIASFVLLSCQPAVPVTTPSQQPSTPPEPPASASAWIPDGVITQGEYQKSKSYDDYEINWSSDNDYVYIGMKTKTSGWVSVGFGAETFMKNADIIEGYFSEGKAVVTDMFSTGEYGPHPPDVQQGGTDDIIQFGGKRDNGTTVIEFKRKLDTGDKFDKPLLKGANKIIWSFGASDDPVKKHVTRGTGEIDL